MPTDLSPKQCEKILTDNHYGHLGLSDDGEPFVYPITYFYLNGGLYGYTREGHKIDVMRKNPRVCVQVEQVESSSNWQSVMCWGTFEEITDSDEKQKIRLLLADQYGAVVAEGKKSPVSPMVEHLHEEHTDGIEQSIIYSVRIDRVKGKSA